MQIVRPSGVWNTRAPLHAFFTQGAQIQKHYGLLTCAVARTRYDADHLPVGDPPGALRFMRSKIAGPVASKAWMAYRDAWRRLSGQYENQPTVAELERDLALTLFTIREATVVRYSGLYESYVQAWALNMLLALQEDGRSLSRTQAELAERFSPIGKDYVVTPGVPQIMKSFPDAASALRSLPHISTDPKSGNPVDTPSSPELNALRTIGFWRDFRNHIVHRGSRISPGFCRSHGEFFEALREPYGSTLKPLAPGQLFQLPDLLYYAITTTHNKAAVFLNQNLTETSNGLRGRIHHPSAGVPEPSRFDNTANPGRLLEPNDHPESLAFVDQFLFVPEQDEPPTNEA